MTALPVEINAAQSRNNAAAPVTIRNNSIGVQKEPVMDVKPTSDGHGAMPMAPVGVNTLFWFHHLIATDSRSYRPGKLTVPSRTIALFKPYDVVCQFSEAGGRSTLKDFVPVAGIYPAGRLDRDSEGLLLLTDDGALAHRLTDPRFEHPKIYLVQVERVPDHAVLEALRLGVVLSDGPTRPAEVDLSDEPVALADRSVPIRFRKNVPTAWLRLTIREGRNRQVRRMTAAVGHPTLRLVRIAVGPITLGDLTPGQWRELGGDELAELGKVREDRPDRRPQPDARRRRRRGP